MIESHSLVSNITGFQASAFLIYKGSCGRLITRICAIAPALNALSILPQNLEELLISIHTRLIASTRSATTANDKEIFEMLNLNLIECVTEMCLLDETAMTEVFGGARLEDEEDFSNDLDDLEDPFEVLPLPFLVYNYENEPEPNLECKIEASHEQENTAQGQSLQSRTQSSDFNAQISIPVEQDNSYPQIFITNAEDIFESRPSTRTIVPAVPPSRPPPSPTSQKAKLLRSSSVNQGPPAAESGHRRASSAGSTSNVKPIILF